MSTLLSRFTVFFFLALALVCQISAAQQTEASATQRSLRGLASESATAVDVATRLLNAVNAERAKAKLPPLCMCSKLRAAALAHARDMATRNFMSHTGSSGSSVESRVKARGFPFTAVGENVAAGQPSVAKVMASWMSSPGHRANILSPTYRFFGAGHAYNSRATYYHYWTQNFAADNTRTTCA